MTGKRVHRIRSHYEPRIAAGRPSHEVLDWASPRSQQARFQVLLANVDLHGQKLLDVGCGLGDLFALLKSRAIEADYTGVDLLDKMVQEASRRHPDGRFVCADVFTTRPFAPASFDVVFCSGLFNLNLGNNLDFLPEALQRFGELSRRHVVFNLLHVRSAVENETYFYHDPQHVRALVESMGCTCRIIDDYLQNDFTVICRKGAADATAP